MVTNSAHSLEYAGHHRSQPDRDCFLTRNGAPFRCGFCGAGSAEGPCGCFFLKRALEIHAPRDTQGGFANPARIGASGRPPLLGTTPPMEKTPFSAYAAGRRTRDHGVGPESLAPCSISDGCSKGIAVHVRGIYPVHLVHLNFGSAIAVRVSGFPSLSASGHLPRRNGPISAPVVEKSEILIFSRVITRLRFASTNLPRHPRNRGPATSNAAACAAWFSPFVPCPTPRTGQRQGERIPVPDGNVKCEPDVMHTYPSFRALPRSASATAWPRESPALPIDIFTVHRIKKNAGCRDDGCLMPCVLWTGSLVLVRPSATLPPGPVLDRLASLALAQLATSLAVGESRTRMPETQRKGRIHQATASTGMVSFLFFCNIS